jgi:hypothetical protein
MRGEGAESNRTIIGNIDIVGEHESDTESLGVTVVQGRSNVRKGGGVFACMDGDVNSMLSGILTCRCMV